MTESNPLRTRQMQDRLNQDALTGSVGILDPPKKAFNRTGANLAGLNIDNSRLSFQLGEIGSLVIATDKREVHPEAQAAPLQFAIEMRGRDIRGDKESIGPGRRGKKLIDARPEHVLVGHLNIGGRLHQMLLG